MPLWLPGGGHSPEVSPEDAAGGAAAGGMGGAGAGAAGGEAAGAWNVRREHVRWSRAAVLVPAGKGGGGKLLASA